MSPSPVPAVIAVVIHGDRALLVRRANPPDAGLWGFPGGKIEFGETVLEIRDLLISELVHRYAADDHAAGRELPHRPASKSASARLIFPPPVESSC